MREHERDSNLKLYQTHFGRICQVSGVPVSAQIEAGSKMGRKRFGWKSDSQKGHVLKSPNHPKGLALHSLVSFHLLVPTNWV